MDVWNLRHANVMFLFSSLDSRCANYYWFKGAIQHQTQHFSRNLLQPVAYRQGAGFATESVVRKRRGRKTVGIKIGCKGSEEKDRCKSRGEELRCSQDHNNQLWEGRCDWKNLPLGHSTTGTDLLKRALCGNKTFTSVSNLWHEHKKKKSISLISFWGSMVDVCCLLATNLWRMDGFSIDFSRNFSFAALAVTQCTHRTSFPHLTGWFFSCRREGRWRGPPESSARYPGSTRPQRPRPGSCPHCPRPAHLLGYRWRSTRWTQWWRLTLGPTPSPNVKGSVGDLWNEDTSCLFLANNVWSS